MARHKKKRGCLRLQPVTIWRTWWRLGKRGEEFQVWCGTPEMAERELEQAKKDSGVLFGEGAVHQIKVYRNRGALIALLNEFAR